MDWRVSGNNLSTHLIWDWSEVGGSLCVYDLLRGGSLGEGLAMGESQGQQRQTDAKQLLRQSVKGQGKQGAGPDL